MDVALFATCLADNFTPRAAQAVVLVLEKLGCGVRFPAAQTCCGQPWFNSGFHGEAAALAKRMIEVFEDAEHVVTPSGSCCAMVHERFPTLLADHGKWAARARALAAKTREFAVFLTDVLRVDLHALGCAWPGSVTAHEACHGRAVGAADAAHRLLDTIAELDVRPLDNAEQCCGFGGIFAVTFPDVSAAMARDKAKAIAATGADVLVCSDAGCGLNIAGMIHRDGRPLRMKHVAEIVAEGLGLLPRDDPAEAPR